jgi:HSP20 family molecular chaperone IbpA
MTKKRQTQNQSFDYELVEKWLENYFLDPLTSYHDQTQFRIDLYETEKEWIVEALLTEYDASEIKVYIEESKLCITATKYPPSENQSQKLRSIDFPFLVIKQEVFATFTNGILEIFISKTKNGVGKNRFITLP